MPRRRRSQSNGMDTQPTTTTTMSHHISPQLVQKDLLRVALIYVSLLIVLGLTAYWQSRSGVPTQIGHAMRVFLGF